MYRDHCLITPKKMIMSEKSNQINQLLEKLDILLRKQEVFSKEISDLRIEIENLKIAEQNAVVEDKLVIETQTQRKEEIVAPVQEKVLEKPSVQEPIKPKVVEPEPESETTQLIRDIEKYIGENLISKIGIVITVIGVAIGVKYSIEHELISPLVRIILGYLFGLGLLAVGIRLKASYENYSAVLVSGAMAIMYFITYFAYSFYGLMPQWLAFVLMVIITALTVFAALKYNRQVIAHIGLVGAYTIPFILSKESGNIIVLLSYITIINIGILIIAFQKYWKFLYYSSFILSWLIYFIWYATTYKEVEHFSIAITFLSVFFILFYAIFLSYKFIRKEKFDIVDIILLLSNSFIFYGIGYSIVDSNETGKNLLGLYTACNAIIHFVVCILIYSRKLFDKNLFYFILGLVVIFATIAIPVQLDGNWVTLLWSGETALLLWIGRTKSNKTYEILAYPLILLSFISLAHDWVSAYSKISAENYELGFTPFINVHLLTSLLFVSSLGFISYLDRNKKYTTSLSIDVDLMKVIAFIYNAFLIFSLYNAFRLEIAAYWSKLYFSSKVYIPGEIEKTYYNVDLIRFKMLWLINYSALFLTLLSLYEIKKLKNEIVGYISFGLNILLIFIFLTLGLYTLSELRDTFLQQILSQYYPKGILNIEIRYISFIFIGSILYISYRLVTQDFLKTKLNMFYDFALYISVLWIASSELISWMDIAGSNQSYKLGLSILWGFYSFLIISLGIWLRKQYLRIGAIILFAITLLKLFFYDISHLNTISKTIVFVVLGILLLLISFLYNKYKNIIIENPEKKEDKITS